MSAHAILSPSSAHRWMACPPSARLEQQFPDESSQYAEEGTFAHQMAELILSVELGYITKKMFKSQFKKMSDSPFYSTEMTDHIQAYVDVVMEKINEARARTKDSVVMLEQKLDFSEFVPEGYGTGDVVIISEDIIEVVDLKYGKGVPISAENNPQTRLYGLGAIRTYEMLYNFSRVRMTIIQPRLDSISTEEMTVDDLLYWATNTVMGAAEKAFNGEGEFQPGEHCRFCRARVTCRARAEYNLELARYDFQEPFLLTNEEIADILARAEELHKWVKDVQDYALDQAENHGVKFPGWKLVEGRSVRKYVDEEAVAKALIEAGFSEDAIYTRSLLGITAMEKTIGKKKFAELLSDLVIKPAGKPTLVPESDRRPEINSIDAAKADFS